MKNTEKYYKQVSVKERLPEHRSDVIVITQHGTTIAWCDGTEKRNWTLLYDPHARIEKTLEESLMNTSIITYWLEEIPCAVMEEKEIDERELEKIIIAEATKVGMYGGYAMKDYRCFKAGYKAASRPCRSSQTEK